MSGFVLHPAAFADLEEIWEFIAADSLDAADRMLEEIFEVIHSLVPFPLAGHIVPILLPGRFAFTPCEIF